MIGLKEFNNTTDKEYTNIRIPSTLHKQLLSKKRPHQALAGVIEELILTVTEEICPICKKHSAGCLEHKVCATNKEVQGYQEKV